MKTYPISNEEIIFRNLGNCTKSTVTFHPLIGNELHNDNLIIVS